MVGRRRTVKFTLTDKPILTRDILNTGTVKLTRIRQVINLMATVEAHRWMEENRAEGKIVVVT